VVEVGAPGGADFVGEAELGTHLLKEAAAETLAENVGHDFKGGIVFVVENAAHLSHGEAGLGDIGFGGEVDAGFGGVVDRWEGRHWGWVAFQAPKRAWSLVFISAASKSP